MARRSSITRADRIADMPSDAVKHVDGDMEYYTYSRAPGQFSVVAWSSKRTVKPDMRFYYSTEEKREAAIVAWKRKVNEKLAYRAERKAQAKINASVLSVGDILYTSWGYEQTNVNFYQVIRVTDASVEIREIESEIVSPGQKTAVKDKFIGEATMHRVGAWGVKVHGSTCASPWDGLPRRYSDYH